MSDEKPRIITRRDLLRGAGAVAAAAAAGAAAPGAGVPVAEAAQAPAPPIAAREALETLTAQEADLLDLIAARLIPSDALGPGAREAKVVRYIDRALGGALAGSRDAYRSGLAAFDRYCRMSRAKPFGELTPIDQDSVLIDVETGAASGSGAGFAGSSAQFFTMVLNHTRQGMFGDPYYGGNANFIGWNLIAYPGVRTVVTATDQKHLESNELKPNHKSAYDHDMFTKASAQNLSHQSPSEEGLPRRSPGDSQAKAGAWDLSRRSPGKEGA
jgi:gluconate 2-dehydrogenase gamma chain